MCDSPNYSTILFDLHDVVSEDNHSKANDMSYDSIDSFDSEGIPSPKLTSSPIKSKPTRQTKNRPLRIVNVNCQSLNNKKDRFLNLTDSTKPDVIIATETWIHSESLSAEFFSTHYEVHRRDRPDKKGGGVLIAVNSEYANSRVKDLEPTSSESLWVKIDSPKSKAIYIGACYRPEHNDLTTIDDLNTSLEKICGRPNNITILGGDFNFPGWDWKNNRLKPNTNYSTIHHQFGDMLHHHGLTQVVTEPTRGENVLDLIATNCPNQVNRLEVIPGISDHEVVYVELEATPCRRKQVPRLVPIYSRADWPKLKEHAAIIADTIRNTKTNATVDQLWETFKSLLLEGVSKFIPHRRTKTKDSCPGLLMI